MAKLTITSGSPALDGEYEIDLAAGFTKAEYFLMKKEIGVVVGDLAKGAPIDMNVMTAFALVMLARADKVDQFPAYMKTLDSQTIWDWTDKEAGDDLPLTSSSGRDADESSKSKSSGATTNGSSELSPETTLAATGRPVSDTTATFDHPTSATSPRPS